MSQDSFHVPWVRHVVSGLVHHSRWLWRWLGNVETWVLKDRLSDIPLKNGIYVAGLARSGSTVLLEILASHPAVASHQYNDFPFIYTPYWWHHTLENSRNQRLLPTERAHGDRLKVTPKSPEAMEEMLWMAFFDGLHDPSHSNVLDASTSNEKFEKFYRRHLQKLLLVHGKSRYVAKGNYNLTRLEYLLNNFPDARFVIPVRHPYWQIASLRKQHTIFTKAAEQHPRSVAHLERVGHYEFGPHRRPINANDTATVASIQQLWNSGQEVRGWARYWAHLYGWIAARLRKNQALREASIVIRYEDLCENTEQQLRKLLQHCVLDDAADALVAQYCDTISQPDYYSPDFTEDEKAAIRDETKAVGQLFGYDSRKVCEGWEFTP